jgi:hypothetical protein
VVPHSSGGETPWCNALKVTEPQRAAIGAGKKLAGCDRSELLVHREDGRIREKNSYGNDPRPPKG